MSNNLSDVELRLAASQMVIYALVCTCLEKTPGQSPAPDLKTRLSREMATTHRHLKLLKNYNLLRDPKVLGLAEDHLITIADAFLDLF